MTAAASKRRGRSQSPAPEPATTTEPSEPSPAPRITGKVELVKLDRVRPNSWNPNRMTEFQVESTREGMRREGWLAAYALLVWRTDETGRERNIIIDGEHRWRIAKELGFEKGPMAFLDGIPERRAKEMTIEFDNKRGRFDDVALADLIKDIGVDEGLAFRLGFDDATFEEMLRPANVLPPDDFSEVTIDAKTDYTCPRCKYEWSGAPSSKGRKGKGEKPTLETA